MTTDHDYLTFRENLLVAMADEQEPPSWGELDLFELCERKRIRAQETWLHLVGRDLEELGYGRDRSTMKNRRFLINGAGIAAATEIRRARRPKSIRERVAEFTRSDWIALGAFVVSLVALFK